MRTLAPTLVIVAMSAVTVAAGGFDDLIYQGQSPTYDTGYSNSILPGGCTKPDIYYPQDPWNQKDPWIEKDPWSQQGQWDQYSQWNDPRWPQTVPRYYQKVDKYNQYDLGYQQGNLYAPGNEWLWHQQQNQGRYRQPTYVYRDPRQYRRNDRYGNWWNTPQSSFNYNINSGYSQSYGNWSVNPSGSRMVTGFSSPGASFQIGMSNTRYFDPWTFQSRTQPSFSFGLSIRR